MSAVCSVVGSRRLKSSLRRADVIVSKGWGDPVIWAVLWDLWGTSWNWLKSMAKVGQNSAPQNVAKVRQMTARAFTPLQSSVPWSGPLFGPLRKKSTQLCNPTVPRVPRVPDCHWDSYWPALSNQPPLCHHSTTIVLWMIWVQVCDIIWCWYLFVDGKFVAQGNSWLIMLHHLKTLPSPRKRVCFWVPAQFIYMPLLPTALAVVSLFSCMFSNDSWTKDYDVQNHPLQQQNKMKKHHISPNKKLQLHQKNIQVIQLGPGDPAVLRQLLRSQSGLRGPHLQSHFAGEESRLGGAQQSSDLTRWGVVRIENLVKKIENGNEQLVNLLKNMVTVLGFCSMLEKKCRTLKHKKWTDAFSRRLICSESCRDVHSPKRNSGSMVSSFSVTRSGNCFRSSLWGHHRFFKRIVWRLILTAQKVIWKIMAQKETTTRLRYMLQLLCTCSAASFSWSLPSMEHGDIGLWGGKLLDWKPVFTADEKLSVESVISCWPIPLATFFWLDLGVEDSRDRNESLHSSNY